jgi:diadenosine tetraphosphatase ApaH/serine/threonine PP2A family protein phosphatase
LRTGIITDVHGNVPALEAVLARLHAEGIDRLVSLGDLVGYGAQPDEVVTRVRGLVDESVLGNHDAVVTGRMRFQFARDEGRRMVDHVRRSLSRESVEWLRERPFVHSENGVLFCHGAPLEPEEFRYILSLSQATRLAGSVGSLPAVTFIGHSHFERSYRLWETGAVEVLTRELHLDPRFRYLVNVGSVGQPRDRDPRAAAAIHDSARGTVTFVRASYDVAEAAHRIRRAGLPEMFARRLFSGW